MRNQQKPYGELELKDDFMFAKVMQNQEICKRFLEKILKVQIEQIVYLEPQKTIRISNDAKSVRLDVYVADNQDTVYNVEMQTVMRRNIPKRSRYYQAMMDLDLLEKGGRYESLNKTFIIFVCLFDLFGEGRYLYTFENRCIQDFEVTFGDETTKIFFNARGTDEAEDYDIRAFGQYLLGQEVVNPFTDTIEQEVVRIRRNSDWRLEYMTWWNLRMNDLCEDVREEALREGLEEGLKEGHEEGLKEGLDRLNKLNIKLSASNRMDDIVHAAADAEYQKKLLEEFNI